MEEGIVLPQKIIIDLTYLRSEASTPLTLKKNRIVQNSIKIAPLKFKLHHPDLKGL